MPIKFDFNGPLNNGRDKMREIDEERERERKREREREREGLCHFNDYLNNGELRL